MSRRCLACILTIVLLCSLLAGCAGKTESDKAFPNVFNDILSTAKCYLVWDSDSPDEYIICSNTKYVTSESGKDITLLEDLLNVLAEADCYTYGRKINEKRPKDIRYSEDEINSNIETGKRILAEVKENCRLAIYAMDKNPETENGVLKIDSVLYALFLARDYESSNASEPFKQQNRWVLLDEDGDMVVVGGGNYKEVKDYCGEMQKDMFDAHDDLKRFKVDAVKIEVKTD